MNANPAIIVDVREGATSPLQFTLGRTSNRAFVGDDLTGFGEISLYLKAKRDGVQRVLHRSDGKIDIVTAALGIIEVVRDEDDFLFRDIEYEAYFQATDAGGDKIHYPEGGVIIFRVFKRNTAV